MRSFSNQANFASGANANFIDGMYEQWTEDPTSVHSSWQVYFTTMDEQGEGSFETPPTMGVAENEKKVDAILAML